MNVKAEQDSLKNVVEDILFSDEESRSDDDRLYFLVISRIAKYRGMDINSISIARFLTARKQLGFPKFESVRRSRQKAQADDPFLRAVETILGFRTKREGEFRKWALEES